MYAVKHDYPDLMDLAAKECVKFTLSSMLTRLTPSPESYVPWVCNASTHSSALPNLSCLGKVLYPMA